MLLKTQREKVITTARKAQEMGLIILTFGNFSIRDKETGYICITPSGMDYQDLKPEDIVVIDKEGSVIDGNRKYSVETPLHCAVYQKRSDVFGICHTHSVFATAWASCNTAFPVLVAELAALIGDRLDTAPYRPMGTSELAETVVKTLGNKNAVLMANHGLLAAGPDLDTAFANAVTVEEGAKIAYYAKNIGELRLIPENECNAIRQWAVSKYGQFNS